MRKAFPGLIGICFLLACASIPEGEEGQKAEELAQKMLEAAKVRLWNEDAAAVTFRFREKHEYFWDKKRDLIEYKDEDILVLFNRRTFAYKAFSGDAYTDALTGAEASEAFETAYSNFTNDVFWLQPMYHISSPGTKWYYLEDGSLRVTFTSGGVTPGDTYVFVPGEDYRLKEMKMWVSILPFKGVGADFSDYKPTEAGIPVARNRDLGILSIPVDQIEIYSETPASSVPGTDQDRFQRLSE